MSQPTRKSRILSLGSGSGISYGIRNNVYVRGPNTGFVNVLGTQITESSGHPFAHRFMGRDDGGAFSTILPMLNGQDPRKGKYPVFPVIRVSATSATNTTYSYAGPVFPIDPSSLKQQLANLDDPGSTDAELINKGTTAIALCKPGQPVADLAVGFAELLREGFPHMVGSSLWHDRAKKLGPPPKKGSDEYLNWVFGWQPLISDIKKSVFALRNQDSLLAQYERDSGRLVRRRYDFPLERSTTVDSIITPRGPSGTHTAPFVDLMFVNLDATQGTLTQSTTVEKERWFSGAFTYYLPAGYYSRSAVIRAAAKAKVLLGIELTPEVLWNLTPWSWAADWVANTGDVLSNVSDFAGDGLVMHYGYMMETSTISRTWELTRHGLRGCPDPLTLTLSKTRKKRIKASPFGFGLTWESFTPRQIGILTALGISKSL